MDWQQGLALLIVGGTAGVFLWTKARPKKFTFENDTHCGCTSGGAPSIGPKQSIHFHARKGERRQVLVKNE
jgi:hypothetical protein